MIQVTIDQLRDFHACSLYYKYTHVDGIAPVKAMKEEARSIYNENIRKIVNAFFFKKLSDQEPSIRYLESKWQKLWLKDLNASDIALSEMSTNNIKVTDAWYTTKAATTITSLYKSFAGQPLKKVHLLDEEFSVPLNSEVSLHGVFDLVLKVKASDGTDYYEVFGWNFLNSTRPLAFQAYEYAALDYAFRYRHNFDPKLRVYYYHYDFGPNEPKVKHYRVDQKDRALLKIMADHLASNHGDYYPIRGLSSYCSGCLHDKACKNWTPLTIGSANG